MWSTCINLLTQIDLILQSKLQVGKSLCFNPWELATCFRVVNASSCNPSKSNYEDGKFNNHHHSSWKWLQIFWLLFKKRQIPEIEMESWWCTLHFMLNWKWNGSAKVVLIKIWSLLSSHVLFVALYMYIIYITLQSFLLTNTHTEWVCLPKCRPQVLFWNA